jgi:hypothetical protein
MRAPGNTGRRLVQPLKECIANTRNSSMPGLDD